MEDISSPLPLLDFLLDYELDFTVQRDALVIIPYLQRDRNFEILIDYALTRKYEDRTKFKFDQPNQNALTVLASPARRIWAYLSQPNPQSEYFIQKVLGFTDNPDCALESRVAGRWVRIFFFAARNLPQDWVKNPESFIPHLINFACDHVDICAYSDFLGRFIANCPNLAEYLPRKPDQEPVQAFFQFLLRNAAKRVCHIHRLLIESDLTVRAERRLCVLRAKEYREWRKRLEELGVKPPLTVTGPAPEPSYAKLTENDVKCDPPNDEFERRFEERAVMVEIETLDPTLSEEDTQIQAQLLLASIQTALIEDKTLISQLRHTDGNDSCLDLLLMCGIYADSDSYLSTRAFKLIEAILYSDDCDFTNPIFQEKLEKWSKDVQFSRFLSAQNVAALPIFWKFRIRDLIPERPYQVALVNLYCADSDTQQYQSFFRNPSEGMTPLEFYASLLLDDPPISTILLQHAVRRIHHWDSLRKASLEALPPDEPISIEDQKKLVDRDLVILDFFRTSIQNNFFLDLLQSHIPKYFVIDGTEVSYPIKAEEAGRAPLNGVLNEIGLFSTKASLMELRSEFYSVMLVKCKADILRLNLPDDFEPAPVFKPPDLDLLDMSLAQIGDDLQQTNATPEQEEEMWNHIKVDDLDPDMPVHEPPENENHRFLHRSFPHH
jgi:hypothetical protein